MKINTELLTSIHILPVTFLVSFGMMCSLPPNSEGAGVQAWVQRYNNPDVSSSDWGMKVATDLAGNVIVAGLTYDGGANGEDMLIIKYSSAGVRLWTNHYNGPGNG